MSVGYDEKNDWFVVRSVSSSGAVSKDGRIRVGDRLLAINAKHLEALGLPKVK